MIIIIQARRPECWPQNEIKRKWKDRHILGPCERTKKTVEHEGDSDTNSSWCTWNGSQRLGKEMEGIRNQRKNPDHSYCCIVRIS